MKLYHLVHKWGLFIFQWTPLYRNGVCRRLGAVVVKTLLSLNFRLVRSRLWHFHHSCPMLEQVYFHQIFCHQVFNKLINKLDYSYSSSTSNFLIDTSFDRHEFQWVLHQCITVRYFLVSLHDLEISVLEAVLQLSERG